MRAFGAWSGRWRGIGLALLLSVLSGGGAAAEAACADAENEAGPGLAGVHALYRRGCYAEALRRIEPMIATAPDDTPAARRGRALLFNDAAAISEKLERFGLAGDYYARSWALLVEGGDAALSAKLVANLAALKYRVGAYAEASDAYAEALRRLEALPNADPAAVSAAYSGRGLAGHALGHFEVALAHLARAVALDEQRLGAGHPDVATDLSNLADPYRSLGDFDQALPLYLRALDIRRAVLGNDHPDTANSLNKLGYVYENLAQYDLALSHYSETLEMRRRTLPPGHSHIATALSSIADVMRRTGRLDEAERYYGEALAMRRAALPAGHADIADTLHHLGWLQHLRGEPGRAEASYREALAIREKALGLGHARTADTMARLASALAAQNRHGEALPLQQRAFMVALAAGVPAVVFDAGSLLAAGYRQAGRTGEAVLVGKLAVNAMQRIRSQSRGLDLELQRSLLRENGAFYRELAGWLSELGRLAEAGQVIAMLKESEYFDFIQRSGTDDPLKTRAGYIGREQPWSLRYEQIAGQLAELAREHQAIAQRDEKTLANDEKSRLARLDADLTVARQAYEAFLAELQKEFSQTASAERQQDLGRKNIDDLSALQSTLESLGHGAVALHYLMTEKRLWILLTTPDIQLKRESAIGEAALNRLVGQYREAIARRAPNIRQLGKALYDLLVAPVAEDLRQSGAGTLMLSLDGALRYLPIAALHDGEKYLIERYRLATYTEAARDKLKDAPQPQWKFAGFGLTRKVGDFSELTAVRGELEGITAAMEGSVRLDDEFTSAALKSSLAKPPPVVHLASHFVFAPGTQADSFLLLGDGSKLSLKQIKDGGYRFSNVDLVTLSACETAVGGGKDQNGREVEGFGALAQKQGAKGVIATLWPVADDSTGKFMQIFYGLRRQTPGMTKAEAMQQAQRAFIDGRVDPVLEQASRGARVTGRNGEPTAAPVAGTDHPFFWAPFILMGNWL